MNWPPTPSVPAQYQWLALEPAPKILLEALELFGVVEAKGAADNPAILAWAKEVGIREYTSDATAWCGLFAAICAHRAGYDIPKIPLRALAWAAWGKLAGAPMLGDVLVFSREGGGHVGIYVGEDATAFHVLGGNQSDQVKIARIMRDRLLVARRSPWKIGQPANVRRILLSSAGEVSRNEA